MSIASGFPRFLTTREAAKVFGVSEPTMAKLAQTGRVPVVPNPLGRLFVEDEIRALAETYRPAKRGPKPRAVLSDVATDQGQGETGQRAEVDQAGADQAGADQAGADQSAGADQR